MLSAQSTFSHLSARSDLSGRCAIRGLRTSARHLRHQIHVQRQPRLACFATWGHKANEGNNEKFDLRDFWQASVDGVRKSDEGHVVYLRLDEGLPFAKVLALFVGEFEGDQLAYQMSNYKTKRPMTYDLTTRMLLLMGCKVTKVAVTQLVGATYHGRIHWSVPSSSALADSSASQDLVIDARPSDAINFAVRFGAPIYVARSVAAKMAVPASEIAVRSESVTDIVRTCREDVAHFPDPTLQLQLQLQIAISNESYVEAGRLRKEIDSMLTADRALSLVVAIETALEDKRFEEAKRLRDQLRELRTFRMGPII